MNEPDTSAALSDPIPEKIAKSGLTLNLESFGAAPRTSVQRPFARLNQIVLLPSAAGRSARLFILDQRGVLYEIKSHRFIPVMNLKTLKPEFIDEPGWGTGWGSVAFHPAYYRNGLMYTTHSERKGAVAADFRYAATIPVALQWVLTEWKITETNAEAFVAVPRELMRIDMPSIMHGMQQLSFNPYSKPGSNDYGLLYLGIGDGGSAENGYAELCDSAAHIRASLVRIDPLGHDSKNKQYGLPASNPWARARDSKRLGEIFARGLRNPNHFSWLSEKKMLISDIGLDNIEELNIGKAGADYGWPSREGTFALRIEGESNKIYILPPHAGSKYTEPVAQYDHDEGNAISGGYLYAGDIALLKGKYIFGDIVRGRVFYLDSEDLRQGRQSTIKELDLTFDGRRSTFQKVVRSMRVDLRFGLGEASDLYLFSKVDGKIWRVAGCSANPPS